VKRKKNPRLETLGGTKWSDTAEVEWHDITVCRLKIYKIEIPIVTMRRRKIDRQDWNDVGTHTVSRQDVGTRRNVPYRSSSSSWVDRVDLCVHKVLTGSARLAQEETQKRKSEGSKKAIKLSSIHYKYIDLVQRKWFILYEKRFKFVVVVVVWSSLHSGCWMTMRRYSRSGATMISCFFDRTRKKVKSFCGSKSRTQLRALAANWWRRPEYWTVVELSSVVLMGIPSLLTTMTPTTPLCAWMRFRVSSTSLMIKVAYQALKSFVSSRSLTDSMWKFASVRGRTKKVKIHTLNKWSSRN